MFSFCLNVFIIPFRSLYTRKYKNMFLAYKRADGEIPTQKSFVLKGTKMYYYVRETLVITIKNMN